MRSSFLCAMLLLVAAPTWAAELLRPDPALSPAEVVETQLSALQSNDSPQVDAGIAQTWAFAHPDNKRMTGPLARFAQMIKSAPVPHADRPPLPMRSRRSRAPTTEVVFAVTVTGEIGEVVIYQWQVGKVADGEDAGAWMTTAVSPPIPAGNAI